MRVKAFLIMMGIYLVCMIGIALAIVFGQKYNW